MHQSNKRGRPPSGIWEILSARGVEEQKESEGDCQHCRKKVKHNGKPDRGAKHLIEECISLPMDVLESICHDFPQYDPSKSPTAKSKLFPWSTEDQKEFDEMLALFIYANALPFNIVTYPLLTKLFQKANPNIKIPCYERIANNLLDGCFGQIKSRVMNTINSSKMMFTLQNDASTDSTRASIFHFVVSNSMQSFFLRSFEATAFSHTGEFITEEIIKTIQDDFPIEQKISGLISDNTQANIKSWRLVQEKIPTVSGYGCNAHNLHLLVKDLLKLKKLKQGEAHNPLIIEVNETTTLCKDITLLFNNHSKLLFKIREYQKQAKLPFLALPGETRWGSQLRCIDNVLKSFSFIKMTVLEDEFLEDITTEQRNHRIALKDRITSPITLKKIQKCVFILTPITLLIKKFEGNDVPMSEVITEFKYLKDEINGIEGDYLTQLEKTHIATLINYRQAFITQNGNSDHQLALLLDPQYHFTTFCSHREEALTKEKLFNYYKNTKEYTEFSGKEDLSPASMKRQLEAYYFFLHFHFNINDVAYQKEGQFHILSFWKDREQDWPQLGNVAIRLFSNVSSSADVERSFSNEGRIHGPERSLLTHDKTEKQLFIYYNYRNFNGVKKK